MESKNNWKNKLLKFCSYALVAALSSALTLYILVPILVKKQSGKLSELKSLIQNQYIGEVDETALEDYAAAAMVAATGDTWSYYIPADSLQEQLDYSANSFVGIGVYIVLLEDESGYQVTQVEPNSPAMEGDVRPGDIITAVDGKAALQVGAQSMLDMVSGEEGTDVRVTFLRDGSTLEKTFTRKRIEQVVASGQMLTDTIGYIKINNFNERCASETTALFEELEEAGAQAMIFDVRFNGGGYVDEMVKILDYLLPEGVLFRSQDYTGRTSTETSDAACKTMPMAVLINSDSYSAAEFFAAALKEYDYAFTAGQPTTGKGRFQQLLMLSDGSAVNLSVGKYTTPNGVDLSEVGGLVPDIEVEMDEQAMAALYSGILSPEEDVQLQAALAQFQLTVDS